MGRYSTALLVTKVVNQWLNRIDFKNMIRYAIFPDFPGIPDFHKSKSSIKKTYDFNQKLERFSKVLLFQ